MKNRNLHNFVKHSRGFIFDHGLKHAGLSGRWIGSCTNTLLFLRGGATGNAWNGSENCGSFENVSSGKAGWSTTSSVFSVRLSLVLSSSSFVLTSLNSGHGSSFQIMASKRGFIRFTLTNWTFPPVVDCISTMWLLQIVCRTVVSVGFVLVLFNFLFVLSSF